LVSKITASPVLNQTGSTMRKSPRPGLERSCGPNPGDWIRHAPPQEGLDRIEAFFSGHAYDPHRHDCYAIGYTLAGVQAFNYRGAHAASTAGHSIVIHPDETHDGHAGVSAGFVYRMLYVEPRLIRDALGGGALPFAGAAVTSPPHLLRALQPALADLTRPLEPLEHDQVILDIAEALRALDRSASAMPTPPAATAAVERARQFLHDHCGETVTSDVLERASGLDRFALARQFRTCLGTSPYRYLTMRRLDRARSAIRAGQPLGDAAAFAGFADQSHMNRQFKRAFGLTPGRWKALQAAA
jgi:AraC-like DNA-binding protein